jgi:histidine triad (HIT) family protein
MSEIKRCVFCAVSVAELPGSIPYEDADVFALMDLHPVTPGHLMIIPRRHISSLADLPPELGQKLFSVGQQAAAALRASTLRCDGINLWLSDGEAAFQEVPHVHLHVIPRFEGDQFSIQANHQHATRADLERTSELVRVAFARLGHRSE